jgi:hypothetical protein
MTKETDTLIRKAVTDLSEKNYAGMRDNLSKALSFKAARMLDEKREQISTKILAQ